MIMKTHVTTIIVTVMMLVFAAGMQVNTAKADTISINGNSKMSEYQNVDIEGKHYDAILFSVENYGTPKAQICVAGMRTSENIIQIPSAIDGIPVTSIKAALEGHVEENSCFINPAYGFHAWSVDGEKQYEGISIPSTVKRIYRLEEQRIKKVVIPAFVEYFGGGKGIEEVIIQGKNTEIETGAFGFGKLKKISLPKGYQGKIGGAAFAGTKLTSFRWPAFKGTRKNKMGSDLLADCKKLKTLTFEKGTKEIYIPTSCFEGCDKLKTLTFGKTIKKVTYGFHNNADNFKYGPQTLVFRGKKTKLQGVKARNHLFDCNLGDDYNGKRISPFGNKVLVTAKKIVAPRKSKAIQYAKKVYRISKILEVGEDQDWSDQGKRGCKLAKIKWSYLK